MKRDGSFGWFFRTTETLAKSGVNSKKIDSAFSLSDKKQNGLDSFSNRL